MTFRVGQKVVCVDADVRKNYGPWIACTDLNGLTKNAVYTIRHIGFYRDQPCLWLHEITRPLFRDETDEAGFSVHRFRPIVERKTDISIFTKMLTPEGVDA